MLLAAADAKYCFTLVDVGSYGRDSDGRVFANSDFGRKINEETLGIPGNLHLLEKLFYFVRQIIIASLHCFRT